MSSNYELSDRDPKEQFKTILGVEFDLCEVEKTYFRFFKMGIEYNDHREYESRLRTDCFHNHGNTKDLILHCIMRLLANDDESSAIELAENAFGLTKSGAEIYISDFRRFRGV